MFAGVCFLTRLWGLRVFFQFFLLSVLSVLTGCGGGSGGAVTPSAGAPQDQTIAPQEADGGAITQNYYTVTREDVLFVQEDENGQMYLGTPPPRLKQLEWSRGLVMSSPEHDSSHLSLAVSETGRVVLTWIESAKQSPVTAVLAAVYAMPDSIPQQPLSREDILTTQLNNGVLPVLVSEVGALASEGAEIQPVAAPLVMSGDGDSFVAWVERTEARGPTAVHQINLAYLAAENQDWLIAVPLELDSGDVEQVRVLPLGNGAALVAWQTGWSDGTVAWLASVFEVEIGAFSRSFVLAEDVYGLSAPALWLAENVVLIADR